MILHVADILATILSSRMHTTITSSHRDTCKMVVSKSSFSRLQTPWLVRHCHFLEVQDISDHSSATKMYGHPERSEKMAAEVAQ